MRKNTLPKNCHRIELFSLMTQEGLEYLYQQYEDIFGKEKTDREDTRCRQTLIDQIVRKIRSISNASGQREKEFLETYEFIQLLYQNKESISNRLDEIERHHQKLLKEKLDTEDLLNQIILLCATPETKKDISKIIASIDLLDSTYTTEYQWSSKNKFPYSPDSLPTISKHQIETTVQNLTQKLQEHKRAPYCEIDYFQNEENHELTFIISSTNRKTSLETLNEKTQYEIINLRPIERSYVILDITNQRLRIHTKQNWLYKVILEEFSYLLAGDKAAFIMGEIYNFTPLFEKGPKQALTVPLTHPVIKSAQLYKVEFKAYNNKQTLKLDGPQVEEIWEKENYSEKYNESELLSITIRFCFKDGTMPIKFVVDKFKGLKKNKNIHRREIQDYLKANGFDIHTPPSITDDEFSEINIENLQKENKQLWMSIHRLLTNETFTISELSEQCTPEVINFIKSIAHQDPDETNYRKTIYDKTGSIHKITKGEDEKYYKCDNFFGWTDYEPVHPDDVILYRIDEKKFVKAIAQALFAHKNHQYPEKYGLIELGRWYEKHLDCYLMITNKAIDYHDFIKTYKGTDKKAIIISFSEDAPVEFKKSIDLGEIQFFSLYKLMYLYNNKLVLSDGIDEIYAAPAGNDPHNINRWTDDTPKTKRFEDISIRVHDNYLSITWNDIKKTFVISDLTYLRNHKAGKEVNESAAWQFLIDLAKKNKEGVYKITQLGERNNLGKITEIFSEFFGIDDCFYKPGKPNFIHLKFAHFSYTKDELSNNDKSEEKAKKIKKTPKARIENNTLKESVLEPNRNANIVISQHSKAI